VVEAVSDVLVKCYGAGPKAFVSVWEQECGMVEEVGKDLFLEGE
jgi:hypothetical protein